MGLEVGLKGRAETMVVFENTAAAVGSGLAPVFSTPSMIALMEKACVSAITPALDEGAGSVGVTVDIAHEAATPVGMKVWAEALLTEVSGKLLNFSVVAYDEAGRIGGGTHRRAVIDNARFLEKVARKKGD